MSCCMMAPHRFFCLPRLWRPLTSAVIILFILPFHHMTVPSQSGLLYFLSNACHPSVFLMTSFLFLSFRETPSIHRSILISDLSSSPSSLLVTVKVSAPYISTGLIIPLCRAVVLPSLLDFWHFSITQNTCYFFPLSRTDSWWCALCSRCIYVSVSV